jgi:serine/threonine protein kinase
MHSKGILHGDLKPQNVLVGRDLRALLADLGGSITTNEAGVVEMD